MFVPFTLFGQGISIGLNSGWNMFGYVCPEPVDLTLALSQHEDKIVILKDNDGNVFMPDFGFNGVGDLVPGFGYQIKLSELIENFNLCESYILEQNNLDVYSLIDSLNYLSSHFGCTDQDACNFNVDAIIDNGTCTYPSEWSDCFGNCINNYACNYSENGACTFPEDGFNCNGDSLIDIQIGDFAHGGYVFYKNPSGTRGLVLCPEYFAEETWYPNVINGHMGPNAFAIDFNSCSEILENGNILNGEQIFNSGGYLSSYGIVSGFHNTQVISNSCASENLATKILNFESNGYSDWFIPSAEEHKFAMGNIVGFLSRQYNNSSSSELWGDYIHEYIQDYFYIRHWSDNNYIIISNPNDVIMTTISSYSGAYSAPMYSYTQPYGSVDIGKIKPIRAFGDWEEVCVNPLACNFYNTGTIINDEGGWFENSFGYEHLASFPQNHCWNDNWYFGSYDSFAEMQEYDCYPVGSVIANNTLCTLPEEGYNCDGLFILNVGDYAFGGTIFYIDTLSEDGLVVCDNRNLGDYQWGCNGEDVDGAYMTSIGAGAQNTNDILNNCLLNNSFSGCDQNLNAVSQINDFVFSNDSYGVWNNNEGVYETIEYNDWALPSKDELYLLFESGLLDNNIYWSSSEINDNFAWAVDGGTGEMIMKYKFETASVIPIREF